MHPSERMTRIVKFAMIGIAVTIPAVWLMSSCENEEVDANGQRTSSGVGSGFFFLPRMFGGGSGFQSSPGATATGAQNATSPSSRGGFGSHFSSSS